MSRITGPSLMSSTFMSAPGLIGTNAARTFITADVSSSRNKALFRCSLCAMIRKRLLLVLMLVSLARADDKGERVEVTLETLQAKGSFEVKLEGENLESFLAQKHCVYFEWGFGVLEKSHFTTRFSSYQSDSPVKIVSDGGSLELRPSQLRPHLSPSLEKTYTKRRAARAPEVIREKLGEYGSLTAREYCLEPGRTYHARVQSETYLLPPESGSHNPGHGSNRVLMISDLPFSEDGKAPHPVTPAFENWRY